MDKEIVKDILQHCFEGKDEIADMASGSSLDELAEQLMKLIRGVYL